MSGRLALVAALAAALAALVAPRPARAQDCQDGVLTLSQLWEPAFSPVGAGDTGAALRGWNDGFTLRPGREVVERGFESLPWVLPEGQEAPLALTLGEELTFGPLTRDNVDDDALAATYPGTEAYELVGGERRFYNRARVEAFGSLVPRCAWAYAEVLDVRDAGTRLGSTTEERTRAPRVTLNLSAQPTPRLRLTLGARWDALAIDNAGISAFDLASAARTRATDQTAVVATLRWQPVRTVELGVAADLTYDRDDWTTRGGLATPGHLNLDNDLGWGNYPFTLRERALRGRLDVRAGVFTDGLLADAAASTLTLGLAVEVARGEQDETRNGGFTFIDHLPEDAMGNLIDALDPDRRDSWLLFSSDRGDELHAHTRQVSGAFYVEERWSWDSRLVVTPGARVELFSGGFADLGASWRSTAVQPRLAVDVYPGEGQRTSLWLRAGRHAQQLTPAHYLRAREGAAYSPLEYWDWGGDPLAPTLPGKDDPGWQRYETFEALMGDLGDVTHPTVDRLVVGADRAFATWGAHAGVRAEARRYDHMVAFEDATFAEGAYTLRTGALAGAPERTYEYYERAPGTRPRYVIGNAEGAKRTFAALRLEADAAPVSWLGLRGAVTLAVDRGNLEAEDGPSEEWRDPSGRLNAYGDLSTVDRVRASARADVDLPARFFLRVDYTYASGRPYSQLVRISPEGSPRFYVYDTSGRGAFRLPPRHVVDLRLERPLPLPGPGRWRGYVLAWNLLNSGTVTGVRETLTSARPNVRVRRLERPFEVVVGVEYVY